MTADIELLPLPEGVDVIFSPDGNGAALDVFIADQVEDYARANVAHATAAKDAEIAQLEKANEQLHAHGERMHAEIEALRTERDSFQRVGIREQERAERLAEALRGLLALPIAEDELRRLDKGIGTATRNAAWLRARAALRDHEQGGSDNG